MKKLITFLMMLLAGSATAQFLPVLRNFVTTNATPADGTSTVRYITAAGTNLPNIFSGDDTFYGNTTASNATGNPALVGQTHNLTDFGTFKAQDTGTGLAGYDMLNNDGTQEMMFGIAQKPSGYYGSNAFLQWNPRTTDGSVASKGLGISYVEFPGGVQAIRNEMFFDGTNGIWFFKPKAGGSTGQSDISKGPVALYIDSTNGVVGLVTMRLNVQPTNAITGIGTITISGTTVGGFGTKFLDTNQTVRGSVLFFGNTNLGIVVDVVSDTNLTVNHASGVALSAGTFLIQQPSAVFQNINGASGSFAYFDSSGNLGFHGNSVGTQYDYNGNTANLRLEGANFGLGFPGALVIYANATAANSSLYVDQFSVVQVGYALNVTGASTVSLLTTATGGLASLKLNGGAPNSISVTGSPFTFTCPAQYNVEVFVGGGIVTAISVNGGSVASGLTFTGMTTVNLQTNETVTVTYSSAPTMKWKPL